jgi:hypothetical protein
MRRFNIFICFISLVFLNALFCQELHRHNKANVSIKTLVTSSTDGQLLYKYSIHNSDSSNEVMDCFSMGIEDRNLMYDSTKVVGPKNKKWYIDGSSQGFIVGSNATRTLDVSSENAIAPGESMVFSFNSKGFPSITLFYAESFTPPYSEDDEDSLYAKGYTARQISPDWKEDSYKVFVVSPRVYYSKIDSITFTDSLYSFCSRSRDLDWITTQPTANKYLSYFSNAKTNLQQSNIATARAILNTVLHDVDIDSSSTLTSEAYALLRYNTEYLLEHLPATASALDMLDSLRARLQQSLSYNWLGTQKFQQELDRTIQTAKTNLASGDSIGCAEELEDFQQTIRTEYLAKPKRNDKRFVTTEGYQLLYPYIQSIIDMMKRLPPRYDGTVAEQLTALKSQIDIDAGNGLLGAELLIRALEKTVELAQKQLQKKDSTGTAIQLIVFRDIVRQTFELTKKRFNENLFMKTAGYVSLYYRAGYILEKLPSTHGQPVPKMDPELEKEIRQLKRQNGR